MEFWDSLRDVVFRQLDADGEMMQGTGLPVQLPGTSLCSDISTAIRAAGQVLLPFWSVRTTHPQCAWLVGTIHAVLHPGPVTWGDLL